MRHFIAQPFCSGCREKKPTTAIKDQQNWSLRRKSQTAPASLRCANEYDCHSSDATNSASVNASATKTRISKSSSDSTTRLAYAQNQSHTIVPGIKGNLAEQCRSTTAKRTGRRTQDHRFGCIIALGRQPPADLFTHASHSASAVYNFGISCMRLLFASMPPQRATAKLSSARLICKILPLRLRSTDSHTLPCMSSPITVVALIVMPLQAFLPTPFSDHLSLHTRDLSMVDNRMSTLTFNIQYLVCIQPDHLALYNNRCLYKTLIFHILFFNRIMQRHLGEGKVLDQLQYIV